MAPQLSSLRTHFGVIYHAGGAKEKCNLRRKATTFCRVKTQFLTEIELNDASDKSREIELMENSIQSWDRCYHHFVRAG
jgi:hypothetical protein